MITFLLPTLPKPKLAAEGREAVRIARQYARTAGIYERIIDPSHDPGQPPAGPLRLVESGMPEPHPEDLPTITDMERLRRTQDIINQVIQDRIREAEADQGSPPVLDAESDNLEQLEQYFATATIPPGPFSINAWTAVHDPIKAIQYHMTGLKAAPPGSIAARADQNSLKEIKAALEAGKSVLK